MAVEVWRHLLVDRIAITVTMKSLDLYKFALSQLYGLVDIQKDLLPLGRIFVRKEEYCTRLDYYPEYKMKQTRRCIANITVGSNVLFGKGGVHRYFKLTLYPSQFQGEDFDRFKSVLEDHLPDFNYKRLHMYGKVNYLELALDSLTHPNHTFLPYQKYVNISQIYPETDGTMGTTYICSEEGNQRFRIYDKRRQLHDKGSAQHTKGLPHTRIELVLRRTGMTASELTSLENGFAKLRISDLTKAKNYSTDPVWQAFLAACLVHGVPDSLKSFPMQRKKYLAVLDSFPVSWWHPETKWLQLPNALKRIEP
ncbi:hypothetical protein [Rhodoferax sp.]|uniref:hypothetical protein n=1 Tax=Rhodoferax sp. TaxID=50421 RepID=UPI00283D6E7D|nr:hypothetical protein [Rhodoferax sp.]MDR3368096.1 hypothetical protein [Rhodoferax sp.]